MTLLELKLPAHGAYEASIFVFQQDSVSCLCGSTGQIMFLTIQNTAMLKTDGICQVSSLDLPEGMSVEAAAKGFEGNVPMTQKTEFLLNERTALTLTLTLFVIKTIYNNVLIDQILRGHLLWDTLYNSEQIICSSVQEV